MPTVKLSAFTLIRNGSRFDYPYLESLRSLLPVADELIINVGVGEDDTLERVQEFSKTEGQGKTSIFESPWGLENPEKRKGGQILSEQTNLALDRCSGDWCIYLQADEVLHEWDYSQLRTALQRVQDQGEIEGLLFDYVHFYGSYDVIQRSRSAYRREVRIIRKSSKARSVGDAQSFRKVDGTKLNVALSGARIYHYGWVRSPEAMKEKTFFMDQLYHGQPTEQDASQGQPYTGENYRYKRFWGLEKFQGSHPLVMRERIVRKGWYWDLNHSPFVWKWSDSKKIALDLFERWTGYRLFEYRSYRLKKYVKNND